MDFSIDKWMKEYCAVMEERFGQRIWFMGLQGSYARSCEALIALLDDKDAEIIKERLRLRQLGNVTFDELCALAEPLISWAKETICAFGAK